MSAVHAISVKLTEVNCGACGGVYAINERKHEWCRENGESWNCPYCQIGWGFNHSGSELTKARRALEEERKRKESALARANEAERAKAEALKQLKGTKTKLHNVKDRISKGVCPCCTRSFQNLARHMKTKHPEYACEHVD